MPFRCPACHHYSDQQGHFVAHMKPRRYNCKGKGAEGRKQEEEVQAKPIAQASAAVSQPSRIRFKDIEICGSKEEIEFLLTDWKTHVQTLLSQHNPLLLGKAFARLVWCNPKQPRFASVYCKVVKEPGALVLTEPGLPEFMSSNVLLNFCLWVEGEIEELEEAGPLSAQHKKIKRLVKERAAQHDRNEQLFTKNTVISIFRHEDQT
eukprot:jgi/Astpho2/1778/Aster-07540